MLALLSLVLIDGVLWQKLWLGMAEFASSNQWKLVIKEHSNACKSYIACRSRLTTTKILFSAKFVMLWLPVAAVFLVSIDLVNKSPEKVSYANLGLMVYFEVNRTSSCSLLSTLFKF